MRLPAASGLILTVLLLVFLGTGSGYACGWWGDGEMAIGADEDGYFIPRGDGTLPDAAQMARLSHAFKTGTGVEQNNNLAMHWIRRAAAAGHAGAMNDLGYMYETGYATDIDETAAVFWFRKAAELNLAAAQHSLASMLRSGRGIATDGQAAETWLRRAAEHAHPSAAGELATLIWRDEIKPQFLGEACFWWLVAMERGLDADQQRCFSQPPNLTKNRFDELVEAARNQITFAEDQLNDY